MVGSYPRTQHSDNAEAPLAGWPYPKPKALMSHAYTLISLYRCAASLAEQEIQTKNVLRSVKY